MLTEYIVAQLKKAKYKKLADKTYFGEIVGVRGVWANAKTLTACKKQLQEVLEDWLVVAIKTDKKVPGGLFFVGHRLISLATGAGGRRGRGRAR